MAKRRRQTRRVTGRDRNILQHLAEFRSGGIDVLHQRFFEGKSIEAARSTMRRLSNGPHHLVRSVPLDGRSNWYQLTPAGTRLIGASDQAYRPLGRQATARQFALQWLLFLSDRPQLRLIHLQDFPDLFPIRGHRLPQGYFYFSAPNFTEAKVEVPAQQQEHTEEQPQSTSHEMRLGYVAVDYGGRPLRVAQRLQKTLRRFLRNGWFDDIIRAGTFEVTLLTITAARRRAYEHSLPTVLKQNLARDLIRLNPTFAETIPFEVYVRAVPGLHSIIFGK